jgi:Caspase domain
MVSSSRAISISAQKQIIPLESRRHSYLQQGNFISVGAFVFFKRKKLAMELPLFVRFGILAFLSASDFPLYATQYDKDLDARLTCQVEAIGNASVAHFRLRNASPKSQLQVWFEEHFPTLAGNPVPFAKSVAFLVGVGKYIPPLASLPFVENDVNDMKDYLLLVEKFDDVYVVRDDDATARAVTNLMFNYFPKLLGPTDRFLFYYSGHGSEFRTGTGYLTFGNAVPGSFDQDAYIDVTKCQEWSRILPAREVLFLLDGCALGLGLEAKDARDSANLLRGIAKDPSRIAFSATKGRENSFGAKKHSLFTEQFLDALRAQQADKDSVGFTTIDTIAAIVETKLAGIAGSQGLEWHNTRPILLDSSVFGGTFVFLNPIVSQNASPKAEAFMANISKGEPAPQAQLVFWYQYNFSDPNSEGTRQWLRLTEDDWVERFPNGVENQIKRQGRDVVGGDYGNVFVLLSDPDLLYFVPDKGSKLMWIRDRRVSNGDSKWNFLGEMHFRDN